MLSYRLPSAYLSYRLPSAYYVCSSRQAADAVTEICYCLGYAFIVKIIIQTLVIGETVHYE
jgi:hypothetical protein